MSSFASATNWVVEVFGGVHLRYACALQRHAVAILCFLAPRQRGCHQGHGWVAAGQHLGVPGL
eukprot:6880034-Lingulodinium_polyedra.AAC.1